MKVKAKQQRISNFEARSLMIIAAWALSSAAAVHAQTYGTQPAQPARPGAPMTAPAGAMDPPQATSRADADSAFKRADANHDGKLSREEAAAIPTLAEHFDQADANHDGSITKDEYEKVLVKK
ncbi:MAG: hypothetical protein OJF60_000342 [Burkholderiaceae bacterium]|jgi:hypothetical protein|nr:MAG: hypothetical protein OJF60_000342 [Burkholderiaceae bacterium]